MEPQRDPPVKLSVVTVNLNHAAGLRRTAESLAAQTFRDFEFVVIDGGSTDGSREVIAACGAAIARWTSEPDGGIYPAMNKGLGLARGEYVHFLNSGDWLAAPDVLERIFAGGEYAEDLLYGDSLRADGAGGWKTLPQPDEWTVARFFGMGICHQTLFYRRSLFGELGGYDERYRLVADWDFNLRALLAGRSTRHLPFSVVHYEGQGASATQAERLAAEKEEMLKRRLPRAVYRDYERLAFLENECARLKTFEDWAEQIRRRSVWTNCAMAVKWRVDKWMGRGGGRRPGRGA